MKALLSCLTAPFNRRFWTIFVLFVLINLIIVGTSLMLELFGPSSFTLWSGLISLIFILLLLTAMSLRIMRHACLRGTSDALVAEGTVLPSFWSLEGLTKTVAVAMRTLGFSFFNALLILLVFAGVVGTSLLFLPEDAWLKLQVVGSFILIYPPVVFELLQDVDFICVVYALSGTLFLVLLNGVAAAFSYVQTWNMFEGWRLIRNFKTVFKNLLIVLIIGIVWVVTMSAPVAAVSDAIVGLIPNLSVVVALFLFQVLHMFVSTFCFIVVASFIGRMFYYMRVHMNKTVEQQTVVDVVEPVALPKAVVAEPAKKASAKKVAAKKTVTKKAATKKTPVKKAPVKKK